MVDKLKHMEVRDTATGRPVACGVEAVMRILGEDYLDQPYSRPRGRDSVEEPEGGCAVRRVNGKWVIR
jgi:hypothetical protein